MQRRKWWSLKPLNDLIPFQNHSNRTSCIIAWWFHVQWHVLHYSSSCCSEGHIIRFLNNWKLLFGILWRTSWDTSKVITLRFQRFQISSQMYSLSVFQHLSYLCSLFWKLLPWFINLLIRIFPIFFWSFFCVCLW